MSNSSLLSARDLIHERAMQATGLGDFGNPSYLQALEVFLRSFDEDGLVTSQQSRDALLGVLQQRLQSRLYAADQLKKHPRALDAKIVAPVFILGLPRSGTTVLQHMLSRDPQFQALQFWLGETPMPRPPRDTWASYPAFQQVQQSIDAVFAARPHMKAMHFMSADEPEECRLIMEQTFADASLCTYSQLPGYKQWLQQQDMAPQYAYYTDLLKLIGANEPDKTWLLKCPHHSLQVEHLLRAFPDARIILTHRDPLDIVPSTCSLGAEFVSLFEGENFDIHRHGRKFLADLDEQLQSLLRSRERHPANFYDFRFAEFSGDPMGSVQRMYAHFGLHYDEAVAQSLKGWLDDNPKGKHGHYTYRAEQFGLSADIIRQRFDYYQDYRR